MDPRQELVDYLSRQLVGPAYGEDEVLDAPPDRQYLMGTLYPQDADLQRQLTLAAEDEDGIGTEGAALDTNPADDPVPESNSWLPSSLGLSFYTDSDTIEIDCGGAYYRTLRALGDQGAAGRGSRSRRRTTASDWTETPSASSTGGPKSGFAAAPSARACW